MKHALITGITGQDGSYLAEYLLEQGYTVFGLVRRGSTDTRWRIEHLLDHPQLTLLGGDLTDHPSLITAVETAQPDEVYNLAGMSHVGASFDQPVTALDVNAGGVVRLLEAVRQYDTDTRVYQASTSELFGNADEFPQSEETRFRPTSPYAVAKLAAHRSIITYRNAYDMPVAAGILYNHESPRRGLNFVTRKITHAAAAIELGEQHELRLGNLDAKRDWGHARDYVRAMHRLLQQPADEMDDYVFGTGQTQTVRECARIAFDEVGLDYQDYVVVDEEFYRPADVEVLHADASRAQEELGWEPAHSFEDLVREMVQADLTRVQAGESEAVVDEGGDVEARVMADGGGR